MSSSMRQGNSKTMTQCGQVDAGHRTNKTVSDQCNDEASTSSQSSAKNSRKKIFQPPTKMQQADRKKQQSNKSAIRKISASTKAIVPIVDRECFHRDKIGPSQRSTVGNQSEHVIATVDNKASDTDMTIITQHNKASLRDSIPSDVVGNRKNVSDTIDYTSQQSELDDSIDFHASEKNATAINTDLKDAGATGGISPTNENNNSVASKKDAVQDHLKDLNENKDTIADDIGEGLQSPSSFTKNESCVKPLPKTDDPIARLNALRANISNALKEVKAVLDQHAPPQPAITEENGSAGGDDGCVQFRFVRRVRKKSVIKFDDEEIVCSPSCEEPASNILPEDQNTADAGQIRNCNQTKDDERDTLPSSQIKVSPSEGTESSKKAYVEHPLTHEADSLETPNDELCLKEEKYETDHVSEPVENRSDNDFENSNKSISSSKAYPVEITDQIKNSEIKSQSGTATQEHSKNVNQSELKTPDSVNSPHEKERKETNKPIRKNISKKEKVQKKLGPTEPKQTNKKHIKSIVESKIPIAKKPPQTINIESRDLTKQSTELAAAPMKTENLPKQITGQISNTDGIINEPEENVTVLRLEQKTSVNVMKDIKERDKQTEKTIVDSNKDSSIETKLDNTEGEAIKPRSIDALSIPKEMHVKKPAQKFSNVEAAAREILNQADKINNSSKQLTSDITFKENKSDDSTQFESLTENLPSPQADYDNAPKPSSILDKNSGSLPQKHINIEKIEKVSVKAATERSIENNASIKSNTMRVLGKDMSTKPPVKLRAKRASLSENVKMTPKEKTIKPKRASIGSENELIKIATQNQLEEVSKSDTVGKTSPISVNKPYPVYETSASSIMTPTIKSAPTNKVPNSTAPIKAAAINSFDRARSESTAKNNATLKDSPSSMVGSNSESLAEITQTPLNVFTATITQPIPIESNDADAEIATKLSENVLDIGKPLTSSPDKLVSSESAGLSSNRSVTESIPTMTVVKKDIVPSITPKQSLDELNDKVKCSDIINESFNNNLVEFQKIGEESTIPLESLVKTKEVQSSVKSDQSIVQNGEVNPCVIEKTCMVHISEGCPNVQSSESSATTHSQDQKHSEVHTTDSVFAEPAKSSSTNNDLPRKAKLRKLQKQNSISEDSPEKDAEIIHAKIASQDISPQDVPVAWIGDSNSIPEKLDGDTSANELSSTSTDVPLPEEVTKQQNEHLPSTTTESSLSESEKDGVKSPGAKKMRKTKKVVIRRIKRKLSKDGSLDEKVEPEVCEKPIAEPPSAQPLEEASESTAAEGETIEEPVEEEPPLPKGPRSCLVKRSYSPGQVVMYADRVRKTVKWKKAVVLDKITDISYKLEFDGQEKPAHISYIKKYTDKKVQFGGKEYLEIDYQQEYESSSEEEEYNIWARV